jgi:hypothetical protein
MKRNGNSSVSECEAAIIHLVTPRSDDLKIWKDLAEEAYLALLQQFRS